MKSASSQHSYFPNAVPSRALGMWPTIAVLLVLCFAALSGLAIAFVGKIAAVVAIAAVMGLISMIVPVRHVVTLLLLTAFVVMGQLIYFAGIAKAFWIPLLLGLVLLVRLPAELMRRDRKRPWQSPFQHVQAGGIRVAIIVFFAALIVTTLINLNPVLQLFVSGKEYLFLWGLYLTVATGLVHPDFLAKIWNVLPWLLPLQLPIVLYQRFVVAARRSAEKTGAAWDAVVGSFGGNPDDGGMSGAMGVFIVICITLCIVRWRKGLLRPWYCAVIVLSGIVAILLAEVKFAVLMLPVAIGAAYLRDVVRRPVAAIGMLVVASAAAMALLTAYEMQYWNAYQQKKVGGYTENVFSASASTDFINMQTGEMGRVAALTFWASEQKNTVDVLIGHGLGSSRKGDTVTGEAARRWPFAIARSSLAILLWETGLIGTTAFIALFVFGYIRAFRLSNESCMSEEERATLTSCCAIFVVLLCELPYNTDAFYSPQIQIILMLSLGQIASSTGWQTLATPVSQQK